jgi:DME family drug/metabolite transporter
MQRLRQHLARPTRLGAVSVGSVVFQVLYFLAVGDVGVATATLIALGLAPVALTAAEVAVARALPPARTIAVLVIALAGLALVTLGGSETAQAAVHPARGVLEAAASGLCYAASTAWSATLSNELPPLAITFATSTVGVLVVLPIVGTTGWQVPHGAPELAGIVWLGVIATVLAYGLFYAGLRSIPGSIAMILTLLEPVVAVGLAAVILGESLTTANVLGGLLLLSAVAALYLQPTPTRPLRRGPNE